MLLFGIASKLTRDVTHFHDTREGAEEHLRLLLECEPLWEGLIWVKRIDLRHLLSGCGEPACWN